MLIRKPPIRFRSGQTIMKIAESVTVRHRPVTLLRGRQGCEEIGDRRNVFLLLRSLTPGAEARMFFSGFIGTSGTHALPGFILLAGVWAAAKAVVGTG